ncbi:MAG: PKD domain-containing protein [Actinomycetota bacterium]
MRRGLRPTLAALAAVLSVTGLAVADATPGFAGGARPALFRVGAAVRSVTPTVATFAGGSDPSPPITDVHDPLSARALYVSNGTRSIAFAVIDSQAMFASYQEGPFGLTNIRSEAAAAITAAGLPAMTQADIIIQGTHSHAAPTAEGIWGPVPLPYLRQLHDETLAAIVDAAAAARSAYLQWGTIDVEQMAAIDIPQNNFPGWEQDGQMSVLRALDPETGTTTASFVNVPLHPATVLGASAKVLSADIYGDMRDALESKLGGVAVVGPATLGRGQAPVENGKTLAHFANTEWYARALTGMATQALAGARWITDSTIASAESFIQIPATNPVVNALLAYNDAWALPDEQKQALFDASGIYPLDRDNTAPYRTGPVLGTWLTAVRLGGLVFTSMPGEPFPEIRFAMEAATHDDETIVSLSKGQDDLGYFYPSWAYPAGWVYQTDTSLFNVGPQMGDQVINEQLSNISKLGFITDMGFGMPARFRPTQILRPALQGIASPPAGSAGPDGTFTTTLQAMYAPAVVNGNPLDGTVHWDFGDGTTADTPAMIRDGDGTGLPQLFTHTFAPGTYTVRLSAKDTKGNPARWELVVRVHPRLDARIHVKAIGPHTFELRGEGEGGDGNILAMRWLFPDGATAEGEVVTHTFEAGVDPSATLTVTDGTGTQAADDWAN